MEKSLGETSKIHLLWLGHVGTLFKYINIRLLWLHYTLDYQCVPTEYLQSRRTVIRIVSKSTSSPVYINCSLYSIDGIRRLNERVD